MEALAAALKAARNVAQVERTRRSRTVVDALHGSGLLTSWPTGTPGEDA
jgi:hypothetical protein